MASTDRPKLGDYVRPGSMTSSDDPNVVKPSTTVPAASAKEQLEEEAERILKQSKPEETEADKDLKTRLSIYEDVSQTLLPVKDYAEFLKSQQIDDDKASEIVDNMLMRGWHEEEYPLSKKSGVRLRTRAHRDTLRLHAALQVQQPVYQDTANEIILRYNLAASLAEITGPHPVRFEFPKDTDEDSVSAKLFDIRMKYIERMPGILFAKLTMKLTQFDRIVMAVMREGVTENF